MHACNWWHSECSKRSAQSAHVQDMRALFAELNRTHNTTIIQFRTDNHKNGITITWAKSHSPLSNPCGWLRVISLAISYISFKYLTCLLKVSFLSKSNPETWTHWQPVYMRHKILYQDRHLPSEGEKNARILDFENWNLFSLPTFNVILLQFSTLVTKRVVVRSSLLLWLYSCLCKIFERLVKYQLMWCLEATTF